jgi:hypothetical protein
VPRLRSGQDDVRFELRRVRCGYAPRLGRDISSFGGENCGHAHCHSPSAALIDPARVSILPLEMSVYRRRARLVISKPLC